MVIRSGLGIPESSISKTRIELRMARQGMRIESYQLSRNANRELVIWCPMIINDHDLMNDKMMLDKDRYSISINSIIIDWGLARLATLKQTFQPYCTIGINKCMNINFWINTFMNEWNLVKLVRERHIHWLTTQTQQFLCAVLVRLT